MNILMTVLVCYLLLINIFSFVMYGIDKRRAVRGKWRIPEKTLLLTAFGGGSIGALAGMCLFHHKTRKLKFLILVPLALVLHLFILTAFILFL